MALINQDEETRSLGQIAKDLLEEMMREDKKYQKLTELAENGTLTEKQQKALDKLLKEYDEGNFRRKIERYANNILVFGKGLITIKKGEHIEYHIPANEEWLLKTMIRAYMSPFLKKTRSKKLTQFSFQEYDQFIRIVEKAIENTFDDPNEREVELALLNYYTDYCRRRQLYAIKKKVETTIAQDWQSLQQLLNVQLRMELLDRYGKAIEDFSARWRKEIQLQAEVESLTLDEMMQDDMEKLQLLETDEETALAEMLETDFSDVSIPYDDLVGIDLSQFATEEEREKIESKLHRWERILRAED